MHLHPDDDKFVIHPWYTGRDKGCRRVPGTSGHPLLFNTPEDAWAFLAAERPGDPRVTANNRIRTWAEYKAAT